MRRVFFLFTFLLLAFSVVSPLKAELDQGSVKEANQLYRDGNFERSALAYEALIEASPSSGQLYYNLGNSYFRAGNFAEAILAYERSLNFRPRNKDARDNLNYLRDIQEYRLEDKRNWYIRTGDQLLKFVTTTEVNFVTLLFYFLFILGCVVVVFFRRGKPWGWGRKTFLALTLLMSLICVAKNVQTHLIRGAIVMNADTNVRYGPSNTDQVAFKLAEGMKVHVVQKRDKWSRVILENGESGWIKNNAIEEVRS